MRKIFFWPLLIWSLTGCIGEDVVDDESMASTLSITPDQSALRVGESLQLSFSYTNEFGQPDTPVLTWISSDESVIEVNSEGLAMAIATGQAIITASSESIQSNETLLTVVADDDAVAAVNIVSETLNLQLGQTEMLTADVLNFGGNAIPGTTVEWSSSDPLVVSVNASGLVEGLAAGTVEIVATADGVESTPLTVTVGDNQRTATFMGSSGYSTQGTAELSIDSGNQLILKLSSDFDTDFALGTFIYLSNTTNGANTRNSGLELGELTSDGPATFNVSSLEGAAGLDTYRYVVVLCKPASITFGVADFGE